LKTKEDPHLSCVKIWGWLYSRKSFI